MRTAIRRFFFVLLVLAPVACKEKSGRSNQSPFFQALQTSGAPAPMGSGSTDVLPQPSGSFEPVKTISRPAEKLGPLLDNFNACVANLAEIVRSGAAEPAALPAESVQECRRRFDAMLSFRGLPVTESYTEYFVLAARLMALLPDAGAGKNTIPVPAGFIDAYNAFALENNGLLGVSATEPESSPPPASPLPQRTYQDELVRLAAEIRERVIDWHFNHRFETVGAGAQAAWTRELPVERARLFVLRTRMDARMNAFSHLKCENAGAPAEGRFPCRMLEDAAGDLMQRARAWLDAWETWLQGSGEKACSECERAKDELEQRMRSLPETGQ